MPYLIIRFRDVVKEHVNEIIINALGGQINPEGNVTF